MARLYDFVAFSAAPREPPRTSCSPTDIKRAYPGTPIPRLFALFANSLTGPLTDKCSAAPQAVPPLMLVLAVGLGFLVVIAPESRIAAGQ